MYEVIGVLCCGGFDIAESTCAGKEIPKLPCVLGCISQKFNQPRLLRVQSQAVFLEPLRQDPQHSVALLRQN